MSEDTVTASDHIETVTLVACPPSGVEGPTDNLFIDTLLETLESKNAPGNKIIRVASVRDIDLELSHLLSYTGRDDERKIRVQIVGHGISGMLSLGALWMTDEDLQAKAFKFPHYILDTNPAALGLLSKHAGKISELMLVSCHIGSASSFGYAINGRTLTYTLAELLRCSVLGADDVVAPSELDDRGWYAPSAYRRAPKGWQWVDGAPPVWLQARVASMSDARSRRVTALRGPRTSVA